MFEHVSFRQLSTWASVHTVHQERRNSVIKKPRVNDFKVAGSMLVLGIINYVVTFLEKTLKDSFVS